jgi:hypothetical protein
MQFWRGQVLDVERKLALCTSAVAYENGRRPQFEARRP